MEKESIHISTIPVTIKIMQVGSKKLTVSVFNQIPEDDSFYSKFTLEERNISFIGWVDRDTKYLLYSSDGILLKYRFNSELLNSSWYYNNHEYRKKFKLTQKKFILDISSFLKNQNQIYIAI